MSLECEPLVVPVSSVVSDKLLERRGEDGLQGGVIKIDLGLPFVGHCERAGGEVEDDAFALCAELGGHL